MPRIIIESGPERGKTFDLGAVTRAISVGRDTGCVITVADPRASRLHFVLRAGGRGVILEDHRSSNGTYVNGKRAEKVTLSSGDMIRVGATFLSFFDEPEDPLVGKEVGGFHVERRLGRGGMGTVYLATQVSLKRPVALKVLSSNLSADAQFVDRFLREGRAAAKLNHPNVVQVHDTGQDGDVYYLSMEYMEGGSLQGVIDREGPIPVARLVPMIIDASRALIWAKTQGIVHRDIKPDNLLIDDRGRVKIGDFGIAADLRTSKTLYEGGKIIGTPLYMAPEQAMGKRIDHRVDLYALGATMYYALSGSHPFDGENPVETLLKKVKSPAPPLRSVAPDAPPALAMLVDKLLARRAQDRVSEPGEVFDTLTELAATMTSAGDRTAPRTAGGTARRRRIAVLATVAAIAAALVIGLVVASRDRPSDGPGAGETPPVTIAPGDSSPAGDAPGEGSANGRAASSPPQTQDEGAAGVVTERGQSAGQPGEAATSPLTVEGTERTADSDDADDADDAGELVERADNAFTRELEAIRAAALSRRVDLERALELLLQLETRHATALESGSLARASLERLRAELLVDPRVASREEEEKVRAALATDVRASVEAGELAAAWRTLAELSAAHPRQEAAIQKARDALRAEAIAWRDAERATIEKEANAGRFADAIARTSALRERLPASLADGLDALAARLAEESTVYEESAAALTNAEARVRLAIGNLDFASAADALAQLPASLPGGLATRQARLRREAALFEEAWTRLERGLHDLEGTSAERLTLAEANSGAPGSSPPLRLTARAGLELTLQQRGQRPRRVRVHELSDAALRALLVSPDDPGAAADSEALDARSAEALGVFLLHMGEIARAWTFLEHDGIPAEDREVYARRLEEDLAARLAAALGELSAELTEARDATDSTPADWERLATRAARLVRQTRRLSPASLVRADIAGCFIECERRRLLAAGPEAFFHARKVDHRDGKHRLTYDFRTPEQLADFVVPPGSSGRVRAPARGGAIELRGTVFFSSGEPFRDSLRVGGVAGAIDEAAPNINVAFWVREGDALPGRISNYSSSNPSTEPLYAFGIGYHGDTSSTINSLHVVDVPGFPELVLPANLFLEGWRTDGRGSSIGPFRALWGRRSRQTLRAPVYFDILWEKDAQPQWRVNNERLDLENAYPAGASIVTRGSVVFFTNESTVALSELVLEGSIDTRWLYDTATRRAASALEDLDPAYPPRELAAPREFSTRRELASTLQPGTSLFADDFRGYEVSAKWNILREDASHYSLSKVPGALAITSQRGDLAGKSANHDNVFLTALPANARDFHVTTRLLAFHPTEPVQQAGLVLLEDPDNYIKADVEFARGARRLVLLREVGGRTLYVDEEFPEETGSLWLRLEKEGSRYSLWTSLDGEVFTRHLELHWVSAPPKHVGLLAMNANPTVDPPGIDAVFDFIDVRSLR